jgi:hypothetical protein
MDPGNCRNIFRAPFSRYLPDLNELGGEAGPVGGVVLHHGGVEPHPTLVAALRRPGRFHRELCRVARVGDGTLELSVIIAD